MERRTFLAAGAGVAASAAAISAAAQNLPTLSWRLASSFPKALDTIYGGADEFSKIVDRLTEGRFKITVAAPGEIVPALGNFEAVQKGALQMAHTAGYYFLNVNKALASTPRCRLA